MKILPYVVLFVTLIGYVTASTGDTINPEFCEAVDNEQLDHALEIWRADKAPGDNVKYLVKKASPTFITEFVNKAPSYERIIVALCTKELDEKRKEVFKIASFDDRELTLAAANPELSCQPEYFLDIYKKIISPKYEEFAIIHGIGGLFRGKRTECIDPLLSALREEKNLEYGAIRAIFGAALQNNGETWIERFYDHPTITPDFYAGALIWLAHEKGTKDPIFVFLLKNSDQDDLRALLHGEDYQKLDYNIRFTFDLAIEEILLKIKPGGSRHSTREKAKLGKEVFDEATSKKSAIEIVDLIGEYVA